MYNKSDREQESGRNKKHASAKERDGVLNTVNTLDTLKQSLAHLLELQQQIDQTKQELLSNRQEEEKQNYPMVVEKIAQEVFDNLLFTQSNNELVADIKETFAKESGKNYLYRFQHATKEVEIIEDRKDKLICLGCEEKEDVLNRLWQLTLEKISTTMQGHSRLSSCENPHADTQNDETARDITSADMCDKANTPDNENKPYNRDYIRSQQDEALKTLAYTTAMATSNMRSDKVATVKQKIQDGKYDINTKMLAFNLLKDESSLFY